ncbi:MAG: carboxypeptidase M32 [Armatimonadetes bacterium]|nr:carboxypeptidase M32 [Armatimonadota bacterium]
MSALSKLKERTAEVSRLNEAAAVLSWDQQTYMPPAATAARAEQVATLSRLIHERITADETGTLLEKAAQETAGSDYEGDDAAIVRVVKREYDRRVKVPAELIAEEAKTTSLAHEEWVRARKNDDYKAFQPWLEKIFDIERRIAEHRGYDEQMYDALLDPYEPGMKTSAVERIFEGLRPALVELIKAIRESGVEVDASLLKRKYPVERQVEVTNDVAGRIGFDFSRGRQDRAPHPFCTSFATTDVRITTRFDENFLPGSVFASMHEAGHGMYEQGIPESFNGTMLREGASLGFHESQSRMWENWVGRSREFIEYYFPFLQEKFPESLGDVTAEQFYLAANKVQPSLIRVEADEVTYNLHIMLRFELEKEMMAGRVNFSHLPDLWNSKMEEYLGITPPNDADGVLQDVHWSAGIIGYFPTYALGNLIAAQLWEKICGEMPDTYGRIRRGEFTPLLDWLRKNVHSYGCKLLPSELIQKITGQQIDSEPYIRYLRSKFGEIYKLNGA